MQSTTSPAYHKQLLSPSGCAHALSVRLTPLGDAASPSIISHLITARDSLLQIWEVRETTGADNASTATLHHILSRRLHGSITSLARVRTLASKEDGADRVLVSFKDAKISLMEWTASAHDLLPVSLHTFEKLPQVVEGRTLSATDPASRISVLLLPTNTGGDGTLAILPFFQEELDLESLGVDAEAWGADGVVAKIPYAPSHLLPLSVLTANASPLAPTKSTTLFNPLAPSTSSALSAPPVRNVLDLAFLPGFNEPTLALLYAPEQTWTGRLENFSNNCLVSIVTLVPTSSKSTQNLNSTRGDFTGETTAVVIATSPSLPHSCLSIHPCPPDLGGCVILTANGVLHLEQGGKMVGCESNSWFGKEWFGVGGGNKANPSYFSMMNGGGETGGDREVNLGLEGARVVFIANNRALVFVKSGLVLELTMVTSGRSVSSMKLRKVGDGVAASCVERIRGSVGRFGEKGYVFVGSEVGESGLIAWEVNENAGRQAAKEEEMDLDDDEDLYGISEKPKAEVEVPSQPVYKRPLTLTACDRLASYGGIRSMAMGLVDEDSPPELVAATGAGVTAGFTVFHRALAPRKRRKLLHSETIATRGLWSLAIERQQTDMVVETGELSSIDSVLITADKESSKLSFSVTGTPPPDLYREGTTFAAASVLEGRAIVRVTTKEVHFLSSDLDADHSLPLTKALPVARATIVEPWVLVLGTKGSAEVFKIDPVTRNLQEVPTPEGLFEALASIALFVDSHQVVPLVRYSATPSGTAPSAVAPGATVAADDEEDELYATATRRTLASDIKTESELVIHAESSRHWLPVVDIAGDLKIYLLPNFEEVFSASGVTVFPDVIQDGDASRIPANVDEDDIQLDRVACFTLGQDRLRPHLVIFLTNGSLAIYEAFPSISAATSSSSTRPSSLGVRFVKVLIRRLPIPIFRRPKPGVPEIETPRREFIPFTDIQGYTGVFVTGEDPLWLVASDHGPARLVDHSEKGVFGFSKAAFEASDADFVMQTRTDVIIGTLPKNVCFDREMPYRRIARDRTYAGVTFDIDSGMYVAGALFETDFALFDDEGKRTFVAEPADLLEPTNYRSALELIVPGTWTAIDGYEFRPNEFVSTIKAVSLATKSTESGRKDFIAVGTTVYRGEDLAARGGLYVFEVIKIVADPGNPTHDHRLKLLTFEDTKSVVGQVCDVDGYLVLSMGQKLYVRAFEQDEVLIAVGFLDVGVHVTSLQSLKNFILIGDALQSVTLVVFQEDPYKLVLLGRDYRPSRVTSANFLVNDSKVAFVVGDVSGVIRLFEYDPLNIASHAGQRLLLRTEYQTGAEGTATLLYAKVSGTEDVKQNGILYGGADGSLYTLVPVRDAVFKRLQLLQNQLMRYVQHFGGLNPRGYRIVKNDSVSRAILKGVLDGELLSRFDWLSLDLQMLLTEPVGADVDTCQLNLRNLNSSF